MINNVTNCYSPERIVITIKTTLFTLMSIKITEISVLNVVPLPSRFFMGKKITK